MPGVGSMRPPDLVFTIPTIRSADADHVWSAFMNAATALFATAARAPSDLRRDTIRGGATAITAQVARATLNIASTILLARLLLPSDYGLLAMTLAVTNFVGIFKDAGLTTATIQRAQITHQQVSTLFWINVAVSALAAVVTVAVSPAIATFYGEPRLIGITCILAFTFVFGGLGAQHQALLMRQMQFRLLAVIDVGSFLCGIGTSVILALAGTGYWALAFLPVSTAFFYLLGSWMLCPWRPSRPGPSDGVGAMLIFGRNLTGFQVVNYLARNFDNVLIGRVWGAAALGLYSRAYMLLTLPVGQLNTPITTVVLPALSKLQDDPVRFRRAYVQYLAVLTSLTIPIVVFMTLSANEIVSVTLGNRWAAAIPIFTILGFASLVHVVTNPLGALFIAVGRTDRMLRVSYFTTAVTIIGFVIGLPFGPVGVARGYATASWIVAVPSIWYATTASPVRRNDFVTALWRPALSGAMIAIALVVVRHSVTSPLSNMSSLAINASLSGVIWVGINVLWPGEFTIIRAFKAFR